MTETEDDVLAVVAQLIVEVVGEDFLFDTPITKATTFSTDLELESIEFVALSELLTEHYGESVDFVSWMGDMELEELINLSVGRLVDHITASVAA